MTKAEKIQSLISEHGYTDNELSGLTSSQLDDLFPGSETDGHMQAGTFYPKDSLFGQVLRSVDRKKKKLIETEVDYRVITFKSGKIKFVKGQPVSEDDLEIMSDYQKEYYLEQHG